jgi:hypothetical protein
MFPVMTSWTLVSVVCVCVIRGKCVKNLQQRLLPFRKKISRKRATRVNGMMNAFNYEEFFERRDDERQPQARRPQGTHIVVVISI